MLSKFTPKIKIIFQTKKAITCIAYSQVGTVQYGTYITPVLVRKFKI